MLHLANNGELYPMWGKRNITMAMKGPILTGGLKKKQPVRPRPSGKIIDPGFLPKRGEGPKKRPQPVKPAPKSGARTLLYKAKPGYEGGPKKQIELGSMKQRAVSSLSAYLKRNRGKDQTRGESTKSGSANTKTPNAYNNYRTPQMSATAMPKPKKYGIYEPAPRKPLNRKTPKKRVPSSMDRMRP